MKKKTAILLYVVCIAFAVFIIYAAISGLGYRPRFDKEPYDTSVISSRADITVTLGEYKNGKIDMKIENNTGCKLSAENASNVTLLYQKDGAWFKIKPTGGAVRLPNHPGREYGLITFQNSALAEAFPVDLSVSYGSVVLPEGEYMLLRDLVLWEKDGGQKAIIVAAEFSI